MKRIFVGLLGGLIATVPMTVFMATAYRRLNPSERRTLPPEKITAEVEQWAGVAHHLSPTDHTVLAWLSHFAFGSAAGGLYSPFSVRFEGPPAFKGALYGLIVWGASYLGWLPATGILHQTKEQPPRPNWMMVLAHLVWGACLGLVCNQLDGD